MSLMQNTQTVGKLKSQRLLFGQTDDDIPTQPPCLPTKSLSNSNQNNLNSFNTPLTKHNFNMNVIALYSEKKQIYTDTPKSKMFVELEKVKCGSQKELLLKISDILRVFFTKQTNNEWRVFLEICELSKRNHYYGISRILAQVAVHVQPFSLESWHCWAKSTEELGYLKEAALILLESMKYVKHAETTLTFIVRLFEKIDDYKFENSLYFMALKQGHFSPVEINWKIRILVQWARSLEKQGQYTLAEEYYKKLLCISNKSTQYSVYKGSAYFYLEGFCNNRMVFDMVSRMRQHNLPQYDFGTVEQLQCMLLQQVPGILSYLEIQNYNYRQIIQLATYLAQSQGFNASLKYFKQAMLEAPLNERWKCVIAYCKAYVQVNQKDALAKMEGFVNMFKYENRNSFLLYMFYVRLMLMSQGKVQLEVVLEGYKAFQEDWKVIILLSNYLYQIYFQVVQLLFNCGRIDEALDLAKKSVIENPNSGRLWSIYIFMQNVKDKKVGGGEKAFKLFSLAVKQVPKSGEVWCEGARLFMDPMQSQFNLQNAECAIWNAIRLTPQYGDSWIEAFKLFNMKCQYGKLRRLKHQFLSQSPTYGSVWQYLKQNEFCSQRQMWKMIKQYGDQGYVLNQMIQRRDCGIKIGSTILVSHELELDSSIFVLSAVSSYNRLVWDKDVNLSQSQRSQFFLNWDLVLAS